MKLPCLVLMLSSSCMGFHVPVRPHVASLRSSASSTVVRARHGRRCFMAISTADQQEIQDTLDAQSRLANQGVPSIIAKSSISLDDPTVETLGMEFGLDVAAPAGGAVEKEERGFEFWAWRAVILIVAALWGSNFAVIRLFEGGGNIPEVSASVFATCRFGLAALAMAPLMAGGSKGVIKGGLECGVLVALGYIGQAIGLTTTSADKAAFICGLQVVFVVLFNAIKDKKVDVQGAVCAALGVAGVALLELKSGAPPSIGDFICLSMPVFFGLSYQRISKYATEYPDEPLQFSAAQTLGVGGASLIWLVLDQVMQGHTAAISKAVAGLDLNSIMEQLGLAQAGWPFALACGYTGLITTALAIIMQTYAFKKVSSSEASVIIVSEPLWAAVFGFLLVGETLGLQDLAGGTLIAGACLVNALPKEQVDSFFPFGAEHPVAEAVRVEALKED
ncbi:unnamed protein product [Chrysoparadoxa australica]